MTQANELKFLSKLTSDHMTVLQQLYTRRLQSMGIANGQICTPKPPAGPRRGYKRLSMRRNRPVSHVFGRSLAKISTSYISTPTLDNHSAFKEWLQTEQQESISLTDTDSIPSFTRNTPLRRSCPGRGPNPLQRRPHTNSSVSISDLDYRDELQRTGTPLPCFALEAVRHIVTSGLKVEGVFRKSGSHVRMRQLREQWESGLLSDQGREQLPGHYRFSVELHRTHDIAGLLKEFLRELPEPLLTRELLPVFLSLSDFDTPITTALRGLVCLLPERNRSLLQLLMFLCAEVLEQSQFNKMDIYSLATVLAPGILPTLVNQKELTLASVRVLRQLIEDSDTLFTVIDSDWSILNLKAFLSDTNGKSSLSVSCQYPPPSTLLVNAESSEIGGKVKRFFKRALLSPFDSPNAVPKFKLGRTPSPDVTTAGLYRYNNIGLLHSDHYMSSTPGSPRERSFSNLESRFHISDKVSPSQIHPHLLTGPPLFFSPSENIMRPNTSSKQQFVIRPINSPSSNDTGPTPKIFTKSTNSDFNRSHSGLYSKYATHVTYNTIPIKPIHISQSERNFACSKRKVLTEN